jgi:hypothetical protein
VSLQERLDALQEVDGVRGVLEAVALALVHDELVRLLCLHQCVVELARLHDGHVLVLVAVSDQQGNRNSIDRS